MPNTLRLQYLPPRQHPLHKARMPSSLDMAKDSSSKYMSLARSPSASRSLTVSA